MEMEFVSEETRGSGTRMTESGLGLPRKLRVLGTKEQPLRGGSEFIRSVRTALSETLYVTMYVIRCVWPEITSRNISQYFAINSFSKLSQLILSHVKMVLLSSNLVERASAFYQNFSVIAAIGVIAVSLILYEIYRVVSDPLRKIPGPFWARYTRLWEVYHVRKGNFHFLNVELHEKYGKLHRCSCPSSG